ncbi:unnamed protein product [Rotaria sp. Silwood2]|nr:unnamed protein product [Rotaria sp. Silwood2]
MHNHDIRMGRLITEIIHVHSKLMIIDDRSLVGNRDSEFCIVINDLQEEDDWFHEEAVVVENFVLAGVKRSLSMFHM